MGVSGQFLYTTRNLAHEQMYQAFAFHPALPVDALQYEQVALAAVHGCET
jgi:hypothetical protein